MNIDTSCIGKRVSIRFTINDDDDTRVRTVDGTVLQIGSVCFIRANKVTVSSSVGKKYDKVDFSPSMIQIPEWNILGAEILSREFNPSIDARDDYED